MPKNKTDFGIDIIECEYKESCSKYSVFCFNEYKDICSTRSALALSKNCINEKEIKPESFMEMYLGMVEGLINGYRILLAIEEGKDSVELIDTERGLRSE